MKKLISILALAGFATVSGSALAAGVAVETGTPLDSEDCSLLRDRVTINLSSGVTMAYNCAETATQINVAACHSAGSQKPQTIACAATGVDATTGDPIWNDSSCPTPATDPAATFEIQGRRVFTGSSAGGNVAAGTLDSATCDLAALQGQANMQVD